MFLSLSFLASPILWIQAQEKAKSITVWDAQNTKHTLDEFLGKVVYIDVWASWCGPCRREIPHFVKLKETFSDRKSQVSFVSISVDDSSVAWQKAVKRFELDGFQFIDREKQVVKDYKIAGIPRFILIGKKGDVLLDNAPRPSSGALIKGVLERALR